MRSHLKVGPCAGMQAGPRSAGVHAGHQHDAGAAPGHECEPRPPHPGVRGGARPVAPAALADLLELGVQDLRRRAVLPHSCTAAHTLAHTLGAGGALCRRSLHRETLPWSLHGEALLLLELPFCQVSACGG